MTESYTYTDINKHFLIYYRTFKGHVNGKPVFGRSKLSTARKLGLLIGEDKADFYFDKIMASQQTKGFRFVKKEHYVIRMFRR